MKDDPTAAERKRYAEEWVRQPGLKEVLDGFGLNLPWGVVIAPPLLEVLKRSDRKLEHVDAEFTEKMKPFFKHPAPPKYFSMGAGAHGGYAVGEAGFEGGSIWIPAAFGRVPALDPVADYTVEWVTFGAATGIDIGVSVDLMALTAWFVDINNIEGACNGVTFAGAFGGGLAVTLYWTGGWAGVDGTSHPIGVSVVSSVGIEIGGGAFYNASATQFFNYRSK
jgi:hypothetical protein